MLTKHTIENWRKKFITEMESQLGVPYGYGGGQMISYTFPDGETYSGIDENGLPTVLDCSGGIIYALEQTTGIEFDLYPPRSFYKRAWLTEITEDELQEGDLILVDIPKMHGSSPLQLSDGQIDYGVIDHVMVYMGNNRIITTEGVGGDSRRNPNSKANTRYWFFSKFKSVSGRIFKGATKYHYRRINWKALFDYKKNHTV
jgi:cell wall-associated NlpC family hydrolase